MGTYSKSSENLDWCNHSGEQIQTENIGRIHVGSICIKEINFVVKIDTVLRAIKYREVMLKAHFIKSYIKQRSQS